MRFRFKAFAWHLVGSASALTLTLGLLYLGWYHWPGWYLADMPTVLAIMVGVDVVLGPLLTFIVADPAKTRRVLARDVGAILLVQLVAFGYGVTTLWNGRPLYYAFSENCLSVVQAQDIERDAAAAGAPEFRIGAALVQLAALDMGAAAGQLRGSRQDRPIGHSRRVRRHGSARLLQALGERRRGAARPAQAGG